VKEKDLKARDFLDAYREILERLGVSEQFRAEELRKMREALTCGTKYRQGPLGKAYAGKVVRSLVFLRRSPQLLQES